MKRFLPFLSISSLFLISASKTFAADVVIPGYKFTPPGYLPTYDQRYSVLNNFISLLLTGISIITIGFIIWGGIQLVISTGEKQAVQSARNRITYAILGLILTFLSFFMVKLIGYLFAFDPLSL